MISAKFKRATSEGKAQGSEQEGACRGYNNIGNFLIL